MPSRANFTRRGASLAFSAFLCLVSVAGTGEAASSAETRRPGGSNASQSDLVDLAAKFEDGEAVPRDYYHALALYCEAARHDDPRAFLSLGWMYINGRGVARDDATAAMWLRKAADRGIPQAANLLRLLPQTPASSPHGCSTTGMQATKLTSVPPAIRAITDETAQDIGINPHLLLSVISVESGFRPSAVSPRMAAGLMQLMPDTAARYGVRDSFDERENIRGGATYLHDLLRIFNGDLTLALAAYNAGEAAVMTHGGVPPFRETLDYVAAVKRLCSCDNGSSSK